MLVADVHGPCTVLGSCCVVLCSLLTFSMNCLFLPCLVCVCVCVCVSVCMYTSTRAQVRVYVFVSSCLATTVLTGKYMPILKVLVLGGWGNEF